jgi:hypothetical protein
VAVSLRILRAFDDIAGTTKDPQIHKVLLDRATASWRVAPKGLKSTR